ncbi:MAG: hypothetical protein ACOYD4_03385 [Solirubrobacterales bacterium]
MEGGGGFLGPVQVLLIGIDDGGGAEWIDAELRRLEPSHDVRVLDHLRVRRRESGEIAAEEAGKGPWGGALARALLATDVEVPQDPGRRTPSSRWREDVWYLADRIPPGSVATLVVIEHRWALPLREAASERSAAALGDAWIHPHDLVGVVRTALG